MDLFSILIGAFLGLATNYASNNLAGMPKFIQHSFQRWSVVFAGSLLLLLILGRLWQQRLDKPVPVAPAWDSRKSPYPGLESFTEDDAGAFFGRDREINLLMDRLSPRSGEKSRQSVPVVGPSGSGKSSLVQAGLLPHLATKSGKWVIVPTVIPGARPIENLARSIVACGVTAPLRDVTKTLRDVASLGDLLKELRTKSRHRSPTVLLVIDQAEELITVSTDADRQHFLSLLENSLDSSPWLWVLLVFRPEFLSQFLVGESAKLFEQPLTVGPLSTQALYDV